MTNQAKSISNDSIKNSSRGNSCSESDRLTHAMEEYLGCLEAGDPVDRKTILAKYPEIADELSSALDGLDLLHNISPQLNQADVQAADQPQLVSIGDFRIVRELGRGGMGIVYEAEQLSLGRTVALKILPFAAMLEPQQLQRFKNEAKAAATLHHPNICPVYFVGVERGVHYYAMQFIDGIGVDALIANLREAEERKQALHVTSEQTNTEIDTCPVAMLSTQRDTNSGAYFRSVARLGIQAAEALDYAHRLGIVHRDVKPANLLVEEDRLWIADFGLAMTLTDANLTMSGDLLGTLRYMSPEQASGQRSVLDHRTDIYSLGATLYELIALRPMFDSENRQKLLRQIEEDEPLSLRKINAKVEKDLETIVLKATAKCPDARYQSAKALGDDLKRFIEHKPIQARRSTYLERSWRWTKRNPVIGAMAAIIVCLLLFLGVAGPWTAVRLNKLLHDTRSQTYVLSVAQAWNAWEDGNLAQARALLEPHVASKHSEFALEHLWNRLQSASIPDFSHPGGVQSMSFSANGDLLTTIHKSGDVWTHDLAKGIIAQHVAIAMPLIDDQPAWDAINRFALSHDGTRIAVFSVSNHKSTIEIWNVSANSQTMTIQAGEDKVTAIEFSPTADLLAVASSRSVVVWNLDDQSTKAQFHFTENNERVTQLAFSPDARYLVFSSEYGTVRIVDVSRQDLVASYKAIESTNVPVAIAFSPNGQHLAIGGNEITLWTTADWRKREHIEIESNKVRAIAFSHDSKILAVSESRLIKVLDVETGRRLSTLRGHDELITELAFSPGKLLLASASKDGNIRVWNLDELSVVTPSLYSQWGLGVRFTGDSGSQTLVIVSGGLLPSRPDQEKTYVNLLNLATGKQWRWFESGHKHLKPARCVKNCNLFAFANETKGIEVWDIQQKKRLALLPYGNAHIWGLALSPNGKQLATASFHGDVLLIDPVIQLWDISSGSVKTLGHFAALDLEFSPDGNMLVAAGGTWSEGRVSFFDAKSGEKLMEDLSLPGFARRACFDPSGQALTIAAEQVIHWDIASRATSFSIGVNEAVVDLAFTPDGRTLAVGDWDGSVRLWRINTGKQLASLTTSGAVMSLEFSDDGSILAAGCGDKSVTIWKRDGTKQIHYVQ